MPNPFRLKKTTDKDLRRLFIILQLLFVPLLFADRASAITDLRHIPQDPRLLVEAPGADSSLLTEAAQARRADDYLRRHFSPWRRFEAAHSPQEAFWALERYSDSPAWGENLQRRDPAWMEELAVRCDRENYPSRADRAILVDNAALRSLPTERPHFNDPALPGEGYPFDNFQNSTAWAGTPLLVTHTSSDGAWLLVETPFAAGWVRPSQVAFVDDAFVERFTKNAFAAVVRDELPLSDGDGRHRFQARIGMILPLVKADGFRLRLLVPFRDGDERARLAEAVLKRSDALPFPVSLTPWKAATIAFRLAGKSYGWGGLYENRDCSALTRDFFAPFGLWLPRNSAGQRKEGEVIDLRGLTSRQKEALILEKGVPFASLIGMTGHIMVYVGHREGKPLVFHSLWGLRTLDDGGKAGRHIIGRTVITTLEPGRELPRIDPEGSLLNRVTELVLLVGSGPHI